jgi:hypothetical protein
VKDLTGKQVMTGESAQTSGYSADLVGRLRDLPIEPWEKGFGGPCHQTSVTETEMITQKVTMTDGLLGSPRIVMQLSAHEHNIGALQTYCRAASVSHLPHA